MRSGQLRTTLPAFLRNPPENVSGNAQPSSNSGTAQETPLNRRVMRNNSAQTTSSPNERVVRPHSATISAHIGPVAINIDTEEDYSGEMHSRSLNSSGALFNPNENGVDLNSSTASDSAGIVPELGQLAATMINRAQRLTTDAAAETNAEEPAATPTANTEEEDPANSQENAFLYLRSRLIQYFVHRFGEFPTIHGLYVVFLGLVVLLLLCARFFVQHISAFVALILALWHYQDAARFMRSVTGACDVYFPLANLICRNFINLHVLNRTFVLPAAIFSEQITRFTSPSFLATMYVVIMTELFVMDVVLLIKMLVSKVPAVPKMHKRRVYQWLEYSSSLYRSVQWICYFNSTFIAIVYMIAKLFTGLSVCDSWFRTTVRLFRWSHLGTAPSEEECKGIEHCTICYCEFTKPIKLSCSHIFCYECIRTWLDREVTCPICRATVTKEDTNFRNGSSIFPMHVF
jgi:hypothetical protein